MVPPTPEVAEAATAAASVATVASIIETFLALTDRSPLETSAAETM